MTTNSTLHEKRFNRFTWIAFLGLLMIAALSAMTGLFRSKTTWYSAGPIQIVAGPDEAWCFIQMDRIVHRPGLLINTSNIAMGHYQEVVVLTPNGVKDRIRVSMPDGITFHPNISYIFRVHEDFHLYEGRSMDTHRSVYQWQKDHFELLQLDQSEKFLEAEGLSGYEPPMEEHPRPNDWQPVFQDRSWFMLKNFSKTFNWQGKSFEISKQENASTGKLMIRCLGDSPWQADLTQYDAHLKSLSWSEYGKLQERPQQRGHLNP